MKSKLYKKLCRRAKKCIRVEGHYHYDKQELFVIIVPEVVTSGDCPIKIIPRDYLPHFQVKIKHRYWYSVMRNEYLKNVGRKTFIPNNKRRIDHEKSSCNRF